MQSKDGAAVAQPAPSAGQARPGASCRRCACPAASTCSASRRCGASGCSFRRTQAPRRCSCAADGKRRYLRSWRQPALRRGRVATSCPDVAGGSRSPTVTHCRARSSPTARRGRRRQRERSRHDRADVPLSERQVTSSRTGHGSVSGCHRHEPRTGSRRVREGPASWRAPATRPLGSERGVRDRLQRPFSSAARGDHGQPHAAPRVRSGGRLLDDPVGRPGDLGWRSDLHQPTFVIVVEQNRRTVRTRCGPVPPGGEALRQTPLGLGLEGDGGGFRTCRSANPNLAEGGFGSHRLTIIMSRPCCSIGRATVLIRRLRSCRTGSPVVAERYRIAGRDRRRQQVIAVDQSDYPAGTPMTKLSASPRTSGDPASPTSSSHRPGRPCLVAAQAEDPRAHAARGGEFQGRHAQILELGGVTGPRCEGEERRGMKPKIASSAHARKTRRCPSTTSAEPDSSDVEDFIGRIYSLFGLRDIADAADSTGSGYPQLVGASPRRIPS